MKLWDFFPIILQAPLRRSATDLDIEDNREVAK